MTSVVVTVRNEARHIAALLGSLVGQAAVEEVIVVDALSTDGTAAIARTFADRLTLTVIEVACSRGAGRNIGAARARGDLLAFIDGDCTAEAGWAAALQQAWGGDARRVVAGRTLVSGHRAFSRLHRVELPHRGQDTTWPSCNLAYPRALFTAIGGFDPAFVTAEDIDLNVRAVQAGASIVEAPRAVVHARARDSVAAFLRQAYWNGYGRKQLTRKHGSLWKDYKLSSLLRGGGFWSMLRLGAGLIGYLDAKLGRRPPHANRNL